MQVFVIYYIAIFILVLALLSLDSNGRLSANMSAIACFVFFFAFIGFRDFNHPGDTQNYLRLFHEVADLSLNYETFGLYRVEPGIVLLNFALSTVFTDSRTYLLSVSFIFSLLWFLVFYKSFKSEALIISVFSFISLFFFYNMGMNVIRQGFAVAFGFLFFLYYEKKNNRGTAVLFLFFACLFHKSAIILVFGTIYNRINVRPNLTLIIWMLVSVVAVFQFQKPIVNVLTSDSSAYDHLNSEFARERYRVGFRVDFWLFSLMPIILLFLRLRHKADGFVLTLLNYYVVTNSIFILMFVIPYSDRIGLYSWSFIPFILATVFKFGDKSSRNKFNLILVSVFVFGLLCLIFYPVMDSRFYINSIL